MFTHYPNFKSSQNPADSAQCQGGIEPLERNPELNKSGHAGDNLVVQSESTEVSQFW